MAAVEGLNYIKTGELISLSEQELVDCVYENGCDGGQMTRAFGFIQQNQGISTEDAYPYNGFQTQCEATTIGGSGVTINGFESIPINDEASLMKAVSQQPVSVGIDGSGFEFMYYMGGVFQGECGEDITHAVTAIGYGTDTGGTDYWLLKNSWGETWGENGFRKIIRGQNKCGITLFASYPT